METTEANVNNQELAADKSAPNVIPSPPKISSHKNTKWLIVILLVVIILLFTGGIFAYFNITRSSVVEPITDNRQPITDISPTTIADYTATWQTYRNEEYGFEFKYPNGWYVSTEGESSRIDIINKTDNHNISVSIVLYPNLQQQEVSKEWLINWMYQIPITMPQNWEESISVTSFFGSPAVTYDQTIYFAHAEKIYSIRWSVENITADAPANENQKFVSIAQEVYGQILSTFQFTDPVEGNSTLQIKFSSGTDLTDPELLLPAGVRTSIKSIRPLFTINPSELERIDQNGNDLRYWYELSLKDGVLVDDILPLLSNSSNISVVEKAQQPAPPPINIGDCVVGGCSGQLCEDVAIEGLSTTCEWLEKYQCYRGAECTRQSNGECGWTQTEEFQNCLNKYHDENKEI